MNLSLHLVLPPMRIGIISDTHGVLHARVREVFARVDHIVHAGDVGGEWIVTSLRLLAPVTAVHGNVDDGDGTEVSRIDVGGLRILVTHVLPRPSKPGSHVMRSIEAEAADVVVFGHSHLPHDERRNGVHFLNPASAGPRRFDYPVSVAILERNRGEWLSYHVPLDERSAEALTLRMNQMA